MSHIHRLFLPCRYDPVVNFDENYESAATFSSLSRTVLLFDTRNGERRVVVVPGMDVLTYGGFVIVAENEINDTSQSTWLGIITKQLHRYNNIFGI